MLTEMKKLLTRPLRLDEVAGGCKPDRWQSPLLPELPVAQVWSKTSGARKHCLGQRLPSRESPPEEHTEQFNHVFWRE